MEATENTVTQNWKMSDRRAMTALALPASIPSFTVIS